MGPLANSRREARRWAGTRVSTLVGVLALAAVMALAAAGNAGASPGTNGAGPGAASADPPITVGAGWEFAIINEVGEEDVEGPFTYSSAVPTQLTVTDAFECGDEYEALDSGVSLGTTSAVAINPPGCPFTSEPEAANASPFYSKGIFHLAPGAHAITIKSINAPFGGAGLYLRVDAACESVVGRGTYLRKNEKERVTVLSRLNTSLTGKQGLQVNYETGKEHFRLLKLHNPVCITTPTGHVFTGEGPAAMFGVGGYTMTFKITEENGKDLFHAELKDGGVTVVESGTFTKGGVTFS